MNTDAFLVSAFADPRPCHLCHAQETRVQAHSDSRVWNELNANYAEGHLGNQPGLLQQNVLLDQLLLLHATVQYH